MIKRKCFKRNSRNETGAYYNYITTVYQTRHVLIFYDIYRYMPFCKDIFTSTPLLPAHWYITVVPIRYNTCGEAPWFVPWGWYVPEIKGEEITRENANVSGFFFFLLINVYNNSKRVNEVD